MPIGRCTKRTNGSRTSRGSRRQRCQAGGRPISSTETSEPAMASGGKIMAKNSSSNGSSGRKQKRTTATLCSRCLAALTARRGMILQAGQGRAKKTKSGALACKGSGWLPNAPKRICGRHSTHLSSSDVRATCPSTSPCSSRAPHTPPAAPTRSGSPWSMPSWAVRTSSRRTTERR